MELGQPCCRQRGTVGCGLSGEQGSYKRAGPHLAAIKAAPKGCLLPCGDIEQVPIPCAQGIGGSAAPVEIHQGLLVGRREMSGGDGEWSLTHCANQTKSIKLRKVLLMKTINIHEAKTHLSKLIDAAVNGEPFIIAKAGKPMVKVTLVETESPSRLGFMEGRFAIPDDFDDMASIEIRNMFNGSAGE